MEEGRLTDCYFEEILKILECHGAGTDFKGSPYACGSGQTG